jgi:hypothetical protein
LAGDGSGHIRIKENASPGSMQGIVAPARAMAKRHVYKARMLPSLPRIAAMKPKTFARWSARRMGSPHVSST